MTGPILTTTVAAVGVLHARAGALGVDSGARPSAGVVGFAYHGAAAIAGFGHVTTTRSSASGCGSHISAGGIYASTTDTLTTTVWRTRTTIATKMVSGMCTGTSTG